MTTKQWLLASGSIAIGCTFIPLGIAKAQAAGSEVGTIQGTLPPAGTPAAHSKPKVGNPLVAKSQGPQLEQVVVTAQHRSQRLQETPLAVTAITGAVLRNQNISDVRQIAKFVLDLVLSTNGPATQITIRGIGNTSDGANGDPAAAFNYDGVYLARTVAPTDILYDLSRIEVLRGPQGTLYGRNADVGALNVITNKPTFTKLNANAEVQYGNYDAVRETGAVNVPISNQVAVRAAFQVDQHDGYISNNTSDNNTAAGRLHILWEPNVDSSILLTTDYSHEGGYGSQQVVLLTPRSTTEQFASPIPNDGFGLDAHAVGETLTATHDYGPITATLIAGYRDTDTLARAQVAGVTYSSSYDASQQYSVEARLASNNPGPFNWTTGLYFFREQQKYLLNVEISPVLASYTSYPDATTTSYAAFAQGTYKLLPHLRLTGGTRFTGDRKQNQDGSFGFDGFLGAGSSALGPIVSAAPSTADKFWRDFSYKVGLDADLARDVLGYVSISTGYKAGGFFSGLPPTNTYKPEHLLAYTAGVKSQFFDRRVQLNTEAFYWDYKDYQVSDLGFLPSQPNQPGLVSLLTFNASAAVIYGLETEGAWAITSDDRLTANLSYLYTDFTNFTTPASGFPGPTQGNFEGARLPRSPRWSGTVGYTHAFHLGEHGELDFAIDTHFATQQFLQYYYNNVTGDSVRQEAYTTSDAFLTYIFPKGRYRLTGYIRNLENRAVVNFAAEGTQDPNTIYGELNPPRTYGFSLSMSL